VAPGSGRYEAGPETVVSAVWDAQAGQLVLPRHFAGVIQPTLWEYAPGQVKMLMRATQRVGCVCAAVSPDHGRTWSPAERVAVPNPNSGLDAVRLRDGRIALACNPTTEGRTPLSVLISEDNGVTWPRRIDLETGPGEYSYPAIIQGADGRIHVAATHRREGIMHYVLEAEEL
jgi:predicted neuraminidase